MAIEIASPLLDALLARAAASPTAEICGLLFGDPDRAIADATDAANVADRPDIRFEIDPAALFAALRRARAGGPPLIGHYHSHPSGDPRPSPRDAAEARDPGRLWLILGGGAARLWRARPGGAVHGAFDPVPLAVLPLPGAREPV